MFNDGFFFSPVPGHLIAENNEDCLIDVRLHLNLNHDVDQTD